MGESSAETSTIVINGVLGPLYMALGYPEIITLLNRSYFTPFVPARHAHVVFDQKLRLNVDTWEIQVRERQIDSINALYGYTSHTFHMCWLHMFGM